MRRVGTLAAVVLLVGLLGGCGRDNFRDVKNVESRDPDKIELYNNVDKHPNIVMICIHGVAFVTTTRDYNAVQRVPELDRNCPGAVQK